MNNNNPLEKKISPDLNQKIALELLTHFFYNLESSLEINLSEPEKYHYHTIDKIPVKNLRSRMHAIETKVKELMITNRQKSVNKLLSELNEQNAKIGTEIDNFFK